VHRNAEPSLREVADQEVPFCLTSQLTHFFSVVASPAAVLLSHIQFTIVKSIH
jgi:hypothetical protein